MVLACTGTVEGESMKHSTSRNGRVQKAARPLRYGLMCGVSLLAVTALGSAALAQEQTMETVVVSGQRAALESAQNIKKNSDEIVDSIVAEDIGKLPDRSITEVLQRVAGVSIGHTYTDIAGHTDPEHFAVEGNGVQIRGLTYVRSEINGRDAFTANGGRSLSFEDVPPELMAGVDVYKNPSAEQIEGAVGGLVNLRTVMPFDIDGFRVSGSIGGSWGDLAQHGIKPQGSALISDRWHTGIGEIGILADFAYSESQTRTDGIETFPYYPRVSSLETGKSQGAWIPNGQTVWISDGSYSSWRTLAFNRKRMGQYAALQWRPTDAVEMAFTYFRSAYQFHWDENALFAGPNPYNLQPASGTNFTIKNNIVVAGTETDPTDNGLAFNDDLRGADRHSVTSDYSWKTTWNVNDHLALRSDLQYVFAKTNASDLTVATGVNLPWEKFDLTGSLPTASVDKSFITNPNNYYWAFTMDGLSRSKGKEWSWKADADYTLDDGFVKDIRVGFRWADRSAVNEVTEPGGGYNWQAVSQTWMLGWYMPSLAYLNQFPGPYQTYTYPGFFNGNAPSPANVIYPAKSVTAGWPGSFAKIQQFRTELNNEHNCGTMDTSGCGPGSAWALANPGQTYQPYQWVPPTYQGVSGGGLNSQTEMTYAEYIQAKFGSETMLPVPFDGNIGVRVVTTHDSANGFMTVNGWDPTQQQNLPAGTYYGFASSSTPIQSAQNFTDVLPSLNLTFHLTDQLQARLAAAQAIARPDFSQLQAFTSLGTSVDNNTGVQHFTGSGSGNPNLKPTKSNQFDATLEWYFSSTGHLTFDAFYKDLHDVIINQIFNMSIKDTAGGSHTFLVTGPVNGENGTARGFEVDYQQYFDDYLPGFLKGFGLQGNATYVDSNTKLYHPVTGAYCDSADAVNANLSLNLNGCDTNGQTFGNLPLQYLSRWSYNVALLYDNGPLSGRLAYNWRSKYLMGVNVNSANGGNGLNMDPSSPNYGQQNISFGLPLYAAAYGTLDGGVFYKYGDHWTFGLEAQNITDSIYKELAQQHIGFHTAAYYDSGRTISATIRVTY